MTQTTSPSKSKFSTALPLPWLIVTGVLLLTLFVSWWVASTRIRNQGKLLEKKIAAIEKRHDEEMRKALQSKALAMAGAMQMVNPELLTDDGQRSAQPFFSELLNDSNIAYVAIIDLRGEVRATTDLRMMREDNKKFTALEKVRTNDQPAEGADFEAVAPIFDRNGTTIGAVRVGVAQVKAEKK